MMNNFWQKFNTISNILIITILLFSAFVWADSNGIWHYAKDVQPGTFGQDDIGFTSQSYFFINPVSFSNDVLYKGTELDTRYINSNGDTMSGNLTINNRWFVTAHGSSPTSGVGMFGSYNPTVNSGILQAWDYNTNVSKNISIQSAGGNVGIGTSSPTQKLEVSGNIKASGLCIDNDCKTNWSQVSGGSTIPTPPVCTGDKALQWNGTNWRCKSFTPSSAPPTPQNGVCGSSALSCSVGIAISDNGQTSCGTTRTWVCQGIDGGNNSATCSYNNGACTSIPTCTSSYPDITVTGSTSGTVWGSSNRYTDDSDISKAAVHAGLITIGQSATIRKTSLGYLSNYTGTTANSITTLSYGGFCGISLSLVSTTPSSCTSQSKSWGSGCSATLSSSAGPSSVSNSASGFNGSATFTCTPSTNTWTLQSGSSCSAISTTCDADPYNGYRGQFCGSIFCGVSAMPSGKVLNELVVGTASTAACSGSTFEYKCTRPQMTGDDWGTNSFANPNWKICKGPIKSSFNLDCGTYTGNKGIAMNWFKEQGRCPDVSGLDYWTTQINTLVPSTNTLTEVKNFFLGAYDTTCNNVAGTIDRTTCHNILLCDNSGWIYQTNSNYCHP